jgi:DEAD/DEAH box helicase domain-containing protein
VASRVVGFKKIKFYTNENVGSGELDLPEQQMHTTSYWLTLGRDTMAALPFAPDDRRDGVVGLAFAMRQVAQLLLMCDRQDIGISIGGGDGFAGDEGEGALTRGGQPAALPEEPRIFIYDNYPGGIGFSEPLFGMDGDLRARTRDLIARCECEHGCPTCVGPVGDTGPHARAVALRILDLIGAGSAPSSPAPPGVAAAEDAARSSLRSPA